MTRIENNLKETKFGTIRRYIEVLKVSKMSLKLEFDNGNSETIQLIWLQKKQKKRSKTKAMHNACITLNTNILQW